MKNASAAYAAMKANTENASIITLMEKMGISREEVLEILDNYAVSASQLLLRMECHKYQFIYNDRDQLCAPGPFRVVRMARKIC
jgi:hypothetical protein